MARCRARFINVNKIAASKVKPTTKHSTMSTYKEVLPYHFTLPLDSTTFMVEPTLGMPDLSEALHCRYASPFSYLIRIEL